MKTVEYWRWWVQDAATGRRIKTRWRMSAEEAAKYPGAERVPGTLEVREVPETEREAFLASTSVINSGRKP